MAEQSEFELPVPLSKLSDDSVAIVCDAEASCPHGPELPPGLGLSSRRFKESGFLVCDMSNTATAPTTEGNPVRHRSLQRQT